MTAPPTREEFSSRLPPRGLSRVEAADYIGVSATLFDQMVADRRMPWPKRINSRVVWDRIQLDAAFAALPNDGEEDRADDVWARCAV
jgi:predicted DNA-binding transcriptional regulator AlpA